MSEMTQPQSSTSEVTTKQANTSIGSTAAYSSASTPTTLLTTATGLPFIHSFSFLWMEQYIHAQIWFLSSSLFIWIGDQNANMHSLTLAIQSQMDSSPSVSCLLGHGHALGSGSNPGASGTQNSGGGGGEEDETGMSMAARIASVFGLPVFVSLNLSASQDNIMPGGGSGPELQLFVERTLIKELKVCQKLGHLVKPTQ